MRQLGKQIFQQRNKHQLSHKSCVSIGARAACENHNGFVGYYTQRDISEQFIICFLAIELWGLRTYTQRNEKKQNRKKSYEKTFCS